MVKNNTTLQHRITLISVAAILVISLGVVAYAKWVPVVPSDELTRPDFTNVVGPEPSDQISIPEPQNVMHSDSFWSPLDVVEVTAAPTKTRHHHEADEFSADSPAVSEKIQGGSNNFTKKMAPSISISVGP